MSHLLIHRGAKTNGGHEAFRYIGTFLWLGFGVFAFLVAKNMTELGNVTFGNPAYLILGILPTTVGLYPSLSATIDRNPAGIIKDIAWVWFWAWPTAGLLFACVRFLFIVPQIELPIAALVDYAAVPSWLLLSIAYSCASTLLCVILGTIFERRAIYSKRLPIVFVLSSITLSLFFFFSVYLVWIS